ncbi:MAG: BBP7 family outer membrane beta-barrel protein [Gemmataceae bacterium]
MPDAQPCSYIVWGNAEYLYWVMRDSQLPVLLAQGPTPAIDPATGFPSATAVPPIATVLAGNSSTVPQERSGMRFTLGFWFNRCQNWGIDGSYFMLAKRGTSYEYAGTGTEGNGIDTFRPFTNTISRATDPTATNGPSGPDYELINRQGVAGTFSYNTSSQLWGGDLNLRKNLWLGCRGRLDAIAGFRYLRFEEQLDINESSRTLAGSGLPALSGMLNDSFLVRNDFYGGQLGLAGQIRRGRWTLDGVTKVALGTNHQNLSISGSQTIAGSMPPSANFGLLTQPSNSGEFNRNVFSVVPEFGLTLGYQVTPNIKVFAGYNFMYVSNVLRVADQIDTTLDVETRPGTRQATQPTSAIIGPRVLAGSGPQTRPAVLFKDTDFWVQGGTVGLQFTW